MLEKDIESAVCKYAQVTYGMLTRKFTSPAHRSVPDRLFLGYGDHHFFIEFKKPEGKTTPGQAREIEKLIKRGHRVYVVNDIEEGKKIVDSEIRVNQAINEILSAYRSAARSSQVIAPDNPGDLPGS